MPSGAKKRKAAKKKKELEATTTNNNSNSSNSPQEHDDAKSQDEKGSDGGEVSSPAHQDHRSDNDNPFNEGSEVTHPSDVRSVVDEENSMEKFPGGAGVGGQVGFQGLGVPKAESSLKPEDHSERDISIEGFEFAKMGNKNSSSSSSSSSDDEARATGKKGKESERTRVTENKSYGFDKLVDPVAKASEETLNEVIKLEAGAEKLANVVSEKATSFSPEKFDDKLEAGAEKLANVVTEKVSSSTKDYEDKLEAGAENLAQAVSDRKKYEEEKVAKAVSEAKKQEEEILTKAVSETKKYEDKLEADAEKLVKALSETKKHEEEKLANVVSETKKVEDKLEAGAEKLAKTVSDTVSSLSPKKYEDKVFSLLDEFSNVSAASGSELGPYSKGYEDKELPPSEGAHVAGTTSGTESVKDSEDKPLITSDRSPVRRASWLNCCGIFDVFSGSSR